MPTFEETRQKEGLEVLENEMSIGFLLMIKFRVLYISCLPFAIASKSSVRSMASQGALSEEQIEKTQDTILVVRHLFLIASCYY